MRKLRQKNKGMKTVSSREYREYSGKMTNAGCQKTTLMPLSKGLPVHTQSSLSGKNTANTGVLEIFQNS